MIKRKIIITISIAAVTAGIFAFANTATDSAHAQSGYTRTDQCQQGIVRCANLIYGRNKSSVCFADEFLVQLQKDSYIRTNRRFCPVKLGSDELFEYPFAVMTGEGQFRLSDLQRTNLRNYLQNGGFLIASAGCSSSAWNASFRSELRKVFPKLKTKRLPLNHPIYTSVYDITQFKTKRPTKVNLEALEIDGRIVMIYSPEGLNDTENSGPGCCCCGGNEIYNAKRINANILAYALTH